MSGQPLPSVSLATDVPLFTMAKVSVSVSGDRKTGILTSFLQKSLWCLVLCLPVASLVFRLTGTVLCWGKETDSVMAPDNLMTIVRDVVAFVSGLKYCFRRPPDLEPPVGDSFSLRLRVACHLEILAYAVLYLPHLFKTFLWNSSEALLTLLFICVDVSHLDYDTMSKAIFIGDYIGFMAANALISWLALRYALGLAALRAELLTQPRCSLWSVLRRRRRLARHFAVPLFLWGCNTAVGVTVALRQSMHSGSVRGSLWALLLYSLFQVVHSVWSLALVTWAADALKRSLTDAIRTRMPVDGRWKAARLMADNPDALGFFSLDGRCLISLLAASLGYGVVLYQLTVPYVPASTLTLAAAPAPPAPRYSY